MSAAVRPGISPAELSAREVAEKIVALTLRECERSFGKRLRAIILTGSFARSEATIVARDGLCRVLGDAEFLLVFRQGTRLPAADALDCLAETVKQSLLRQAVACPVHLAAVRPGYLVHLPAHIFSYELRHAGRVVLGDEAILRLVPAFPPAQIDREDAWRLLSNRLIEWLEARAETAPQADAPGIRLSYATLKLWMDAATSLLVFFGEYAPSYAARAERLETLADDAAKELPFPVARFRAGVAEATSRKLRPETFPTDSFRWSFCEEARRMAVRLWCWELGLMTGQSANLPPLTLCGTLARRMTRKQRMRGWLRVARETGAVTAWHHRARWLRLSRGGSPRHWLYAVAAECALAEEELSSPPASNPPQGPWAQTLHGFLPIPGPAGNPDGEWQALVRDLAWNYHEFVERTRA
jgi:hypothetical protein